MRAERRLRIPLQIGTSGLHSLARGAAFFVPGIFLVGIPAAGLIAISDVLDDLGDIGGYIAFGVLAPGFTLLAFAWKQMNRARLERPSDVLLDGSGIEIAGGPHHGLKVPWKHVTAVGVETPPKPGKKSDEDDDSDLRQLCVRRGGERLVLAAADRYTEQRSLEDLAQTLAAARKPPQKRPKAKSDAVDLLVCGNCGAAVPPADAPEVDCRYCGRKVAVAEGMRAKIRDAQAVEKRPDAAVTKLLDQPGAGFVGTLFGIAAVFQLTAWPAALVVLVWNYAQGALTWKSVGLAFVFVVSCIVGFFALIRGRIVDRQALRLVTLDFAAHAPEEKGKPFLCRSCLAPLPDAGEQVLVRCVYCGAHNILGIDLRRDATVAREESYSLETALARRARDRARLRGMTFAAVVLLGLSGFAFVRSIGHAPKTPTVYADP